MAYTVQTQAVPFGALTVHRIVTAVSSKVADFHQWNRTRRTVAELRKLSPRQLDDIGLTPTDIQKLADGTY